MRLLDRPWFRASALVLAAAASLATSENATGDGDDGWSHPERSAAEVKSLEPGATATRSFHVEASQEPAVGVEVTQISPSQGTLELGLSDSRSDQCATTATFTGTATGWSRTDAQGGPASATIQLAENCAYAIKNGSLPGKVADVMVSITNHSATALSFSWHLTATISGDEAKEPPGEFVNITVK